MTESCEFTYRLEKSSGGALSIAPGGVFTLNGASYEVMEILKVISGEADLYIVKKKDDGQMYIFKYYRHNIEPKRAIVEALSLIESERVIRLLDYGTSSEGRFYEIQQYARCGSLDAFLKNNPESVDSNFIRLFIKEMNLALIGIHSKKIIHRDIKPSNILVNSIDPLSIALTDFGISSVSSSIIHQTNLDRTITYAAPEALSGVVSQASDYWSFGIIIIEMLLKKHPYDAMDARTVTYYITTKEVPGVEAAPGEFYPLLKGLLNRDDKKRWGCKQVTDWLDNIIKNDFYEPFSFYGKKCFDLKELAKDLIVNWERAAEEIVAVRQWFLKNTCDRGLVPLVKGVCKSGMSSDASLFELIYILDPGMKMIYKKVNIDENFIVELAFKIYDGESSEEEKELFNELIDRSLFEKYYELARPAGDEWRRLLEAARESRGHDETEGRASIFLKHIAPQKQAEKGGVFQAAKKKIKYYFSDEYMKTYFIIIAIGAVLIISLIIIIIYD